MNITSLYVKAQVDEMLARGANERLARSARTSVDGRNRLADAVKGVWSLLTGPAERPLYTSGSSQASTVLPTLTNYPYRG